MGLNASRILRICNRKAIFTDLYASMLSILMIPITFESAFNALPNGIKIIENQERQLQQKKLYTHTLQCCTVSKIVNKVILITGIDKNPCKHSKYGQLRKTLYNCHKHAVIFMAILCVWKFVHIHAPIYVNMKIGGLRQFENVRPVEIN